MKYTTNTYRAINVLANYVEIMKDYRMKVYYHKLLAQLDDMPLTNEEVMNAMQEITKRYDVTIKLGVK